ncbi:MAG: AAA family ATPase [Candidatus Thermoplasmatota archaeon]|nr:AAA family ATPase [Candidatus Thermoplasmatota archaeon]
MASWLETEAPVRFEELAVPRATRQALSSSSLSPDPPHLLVTGPAGVGKTASWRLVARQILGPSWGSTTHVLQARNLVRQRGAMSTFEEFLRPSGSDADTLAGRLSLDAFDRGMAKSSGDDIAPSGSELNLQPGQIPISRLIVIEDADHLGHIRQAYLRRMMETIGSASRFILVARAPSRIIEALRSRSQMIRIPSTGREMVIATLASIATKHGCEPAEGVLEDIAYISEGNLKKAIFTLELLELRGLISDRSSVHRLVQASTLQAGRHLLELALRGRVVEWRWENQGGRKRKVLSGAMAEIDDLMTNHGMDATDIVSQIHNVIVGRRLTLPPSLRAELLDALSDCDTGLLRSMYPRIHFEQFLHRTSSAGRFHGLAVR